MNGLRKVPAGLADRLIEPCGKNQSVITIFHHGLTRICTELFFLCNNDIENCLFRVVPW